MKILWAVVLGAAFLAGAGPEEQAPATPKLEGHVSGVIGVKRLAGEWSPARGQGEFGFDFDFRRVDWPVSVAGQFMATRDGDVPDEPGFAGDESGTYEFNLGVRKVLELPLRLHPFAGAGLSILGGNVSSSDHDDHDGSRTVTVHSNTTAGWYAEAGSYIPVSERFHLGFRVEYSRGDMDLFDQDMEAGGLHFLLMAGLRW